MMLLLKLALGNVIPPTAIRDRFNETVRTAFWDGPFAPIAVVALAGLVASCALQLSRGGVANSISAVTYLFIGYVSFCNQVRAAENQVERYTITETDTPEKITERITSAVEWHYCKTFLKCNERYLAGHPDAIQSVHAAISIISERKDQAEFTSYALFSSKTTAQERVTRLGKDMVRLIVKGSLKQRISPTTPATL